MKQPTPASPSPCDPTGQQTWRRHAGGRSTRRPLWRVHDDLRISVPDRSDLRCIYSMPDD